MKRVSWRLSTLFHIIFTDSLLTNTLWGKNNCFHFRDEERKPPTCKASNRMGDGTCVHPAAQAASIPKKDSSLGSTTVEMQSRMSQQGSEDPCGELIDASSRKGPEGAFFHHSAGLRWGVAELLLPSPNPDEQGCCKSSWTSGKGAWVDTMAPKSVRLDTRTLTSVKRKQ